MHTQKLGPTTLAVTRIAYGCMKIGGDWTATPTTAEVRARG